MTPLFEEFGCVQAVSLHLAMGQNAEADDVQDRVVRKDTSPTSIFRELF